MQANYYTYWTCPNCNVVVPNGNHHVCSTAVPLTHVTFNGGTYGDFVTMQRLEAIEKSVEEILKILKELSGTKANDN